MERSADESAASRFRTLLAGAAGGWEIAAVAALSVVGWRLTLGWNWSSVPTIDPVHTVAPQSDLDWLGLAVTVAAAVGWLARRGCAVVGAAVIWLPIILLSGWRLAAAGVLGWPISLASLIFIISAICIVAGGTGAWLRYHATNRIAPELSDEEELPASDDAAEAEQPRIPADSSHG